MSFPRTSTVPFGSGHAFVSGSPVRSSTRYRAGAGSPSRSHRRDTIARVSAHEQFVVQIIFTRSSKTVGDRNSLPAPVAAIHEKSGSPETASYAFTACAWPWWLHNLGASGSPLFNLSSYLLLGYFADKILTQNVYFAGTLRETLALVGLAFICLAVVEGSFSFLSGRLGVPRLP